MPYSQAHKEKTRNKILETACRSFNRRGFVSVSIDDVMAEAGLTRGGFYNHFASKEDLFAAVLDRHGQCDPTERLSDEARDGRMMPDGLSAAVIDAYLSREHLDDVAEHCPLVALPADVAHGGQALKDRYGVLVRKMVDVHADGNGGDRARALAVTALSVGAMLIARTAGDDALGQDMLTAARDHAHGLQSMRCGSEQHRDAAGASHGAAIPKGQ